MPAYDPALYPGRGAWRFRNVTRAFDFWPRLSSINISQEHPDMVATINADVEDGDEDFLFVNGDHCWATFRGERIWSGHIATVEESALGEFGPRLWIISGRDYTAKLEQAIIKRRQKRKKEKARRRVRWMLRYLERRVWNLASIDLSDVPDENVEAYDYYGATVAEGLAHVCDETRAFAYIDLDNIFRMYRNSPVPAPFGLDNEAPDYATTFPFREWDYSLDSVEQANAILVEPEKRKHSRWSKDSTSIAAYGRMERFVSDGNLHRPKQARNVGGRVLANDKDPEDEGSLLVHEPGIYAGMTVSIREALWDHDFNKFVSGVEIDAPDPHDDDGTAYLRSRITIATKRRHKASRDRSIDKNTRRRPGDTADTDPYLLDGFSRTVSSPSVEEGDPLTADASRYSLSWGRSPSTFDPVTDEFTGLGAPLGPTLAGPYGVLTGTIYGVSGTYNTPWPYVPCGLGPGAWSGTNETEQWIDLLTMPAHPGDMAGVFVDVHTSAWRGVGGAGARIYVRNSVPTTGRSGFPVGVLPGGLNWYDDSTATMFIPAAEVPAEGEHLWIGGGPAWDPDYEVAYTCGGYRHPQIDGRNQSGRLEGFTVSNPRWAATGDTIPDLGETNVPAKGPWGEPWTWRLIGTEGAPVYGMDGSAWYVEDGGVGIGLLGEREDDDEPHGIWSDLAYGVELEFEVDALGETASLEIAATGEGERAIGTLDMEADTIAVAGPSTTDSGAFAFVAGRRYVAVFDTRSGKVRGKAWDATTSVEPTAWNVECAMDETEDDSDRLVLWLRAGSGQRIRVTRIRILPPGGDSHRVVRELVGYTSGLEREFTTRHPYREGTLRAHVNGVGLPPFRQDGDEATYELPFYPTAGSAIRNTYIIDQGTGEED